MTLGMLNIIRKLKKSQGLDDAQELVKEVGTDQHLKNVLNRLRRFKRDLKDRVSLQDLQYDWSNQYRRMEDLVHSLEKQIGPIQIRDCSQDDHEERPEVDEELELTDERTQLYLELKEVKSHVESLTQLYYHHHHRGSSSREEVEGGDSLPSLRSVVAQMLVEMKTRGQSVHFELDHQARQLEKEVGECRMSIMTSLREDHHLHSGDMAFLESIGDFGGKGQEQQQQQDKADEAGGGRRDRSLNVELARQEILERLHALKQSYQNQLFTLTDSRRPSSSSAIVGSEGQSEEEENKEKRHNDHHLSPDQHQRFLRILKTCKVTKALKKRLQLEFPQVPQAVLDRHEKTCREDKYLAQKKAAIKRSMESEKDKLKVWAKGALAQAREADWECQQRAVELERWESMRKSLHMTLTELKAQKAIECERRRLAEEEVRREEEEATRLLQEKKAAEHQVKKQEVDLYQAKLATMRQEEHKQQELAHQKEEEERRQRLLINAERIQYRSYLVQTKMLQQEVARQQALGAEERRMEALLRIAAQVPYADRIATIQADLSKTTACIQNSAFQADDGSAAFRPLYGYRDSTLFKDFRFRLALALHEAGLAQKKYASQVVNALAPRERVPYL